jgi:hypothetical protein
LLLSANSAIFQLYHGENKLILNEMVMVSLCTRPTRCQIVNVSLIKLVQWYETHIVISWRIDHYIQEEEILNDCKGAYGYSRNVSWCHF